MPERVLLMAVDGLDWGPLRRGIETGRLPNFRQLLETGAHAEVRVKECVPGLVGPDEGMNSPTLWTTVATGQYYFQHGVYDFYNALVAPEKPPLFDSTHVRSPRIWDVLSHYGLPSIVVGYYVTHPAYPVRGVMVSDLFGETSAGASTWPVEYADVLARLLGAEDHADFAASFGKLGSVAGVRSALTANARGGALRSMGAEVLRELTALNDREVEALLETPPEQRSRMLLEYRLVYPAVRDRRFHRVFLHLLETETWRFATVYYRLLDFVSHGFWAAGLSHAEGFARAYGDTVMRAYECVDRWMGALRACLAPSDRLLVVSDHGFGPDEQAADVESCQDVSEFSGARHAEPAVLLAGGGPCRGRIDDVSLLDIAPTILDFLGVPPARTLDGGAVPGPLHGDAPRPLGLVDSYPYSPPSVGGGLATEEEAVVAERLAALGYLDA